MLKVSYIGSDDARIEQVYALVNNVFKVFEEKLWNERYERVSIDTLRTYAEKRELIIGEWDGDLVSAVQLENLKEGIFRFGMLVTKPEARGRGIANKMRLFVENEAKENEAKEMLLEILKPTYEIHPEKDEIQRWYQRHDYSLKEIHDFKEWYPHLDKIIKIPSELYIFSKDLKPIT